MQTASFHLTHAPPIGRLMRLAAATLLGLTAGWATGDDADPLTSALERIRSAYGERPAFSAMHVTGRIHSRRRGDGPMARSWQQPDTFRVRLDYPGGTELRAMDGEQAWQGNRRMARPFLMAMRLQAGRALLPWNLLAPGAPISYLGSQPSPQGGALDLLVLALPAPLRLVVEVDQASGHIVRATGLGIGDLQFATEYRDFRTLDGHLVATREEHYAMGQHIGHSTIDSVRFDASEAARTVTGAANR